MANDQSAAIRRAVLETLVKLSNADGAGFFTFAEAGGDVHVADWQSIGHPSVTQAFDTLATSAATLYPLSVLESFRRPDLLHTRSFVHGFGYVPNYRETELYKRVFLCNDIHDQVRLLVYDRDRFVGWLGAFRMKGRSAFGRSERRRLQPHVARFAAALLEADDLAWKNLPAGHAHLMVRPDGSVEYASKTGMDWLRRPSFSSGLRHVVAKIEPHRLEKTIVIGQAQARVIRMAGERGERYVVQLEPAIRFRIATDSALSPVQRKVAMYAASGATVPQIAKAIGRAPETVRSHLRAAYSRLGVSSRIELARAIEAAA